MTSPDIKDLTAALGLKRSGCFVGAAKKLGITQPAVSGRIAKLEQSLGFPLFHRRPGEAFITQNGQTLFPVIEEIEEEFSDIIQKISYWRRVRENEVNILVDGSELADRLLEAAINLPSDKIPKTWFAPDPDSCMLKQLESYEADLVISGSFLRAGFQPKIQMETLVEQCGLTVAWSPSSHDLCDQKFNLLDAMSSTVILPIRPTAMGLRRFLTSWCETHYQFSLTDILEAQSASIAVDLCTQGFGVLILPGDVTRYLHLKERGLCVARCFDSSLPKAFKFGIRYRTNERNPVILKTVRQLSELSEKLFRDL